MVFDLLCPAQPAGHHLQVYSRNLLPDACLRDYHSIPCGDSQRVRRRKQWRVSVAESTGLSRIGSRYTNGTKPPDRPARTATELLADPASAIPYSEPCRVGEGQARRGRLEFDVRSLRRIASRNPGATCLMSNVTEIGQDDHGDARVTRWRRSSSWVLNDLAPLAETRFEVTTTVSFSVRSTICAERARFSTWRAKTQRSFSAGSPPKPVNGCKISFPSSCHRTSNHDSSYTASHTSLEQLTLVPAI